MVAKRRAAGYTDSKPNTKGEIRMKVRLNEDQEIVRTIREGLRRTGGYCPCRLARTEENRCMCREFKDQIADPDYEGYCHCRLYYKEK
jgi:ferredoxin-thioredoxin reductase catalytic subunit